MDTPSLLGASLSLSVVALPTIMVLFVKNISKTNELNKAESKNDIAGLQNTIKLLKADIENNNLKFESKIEKLIDNKLNKFRESLDLDHRKLSVDTLDRISSRLVKIGEKFDPKIIENLYDD